MPSLPVSEFIDEFTLVNGFFPNSNALGQIPQIIFDGQNVWVRGPGNLVSDMGFAAPGSAGGSIAPVMVSNAQLAGGVGGGVVTEHANTTWIEGPSGPFFKGGVNLGSSNGVLMLLVSGVATPAGLLKPGAPTIDGNGPATDKFKGSYSVAVAAYRQTTGAVSTRSDLSNVIFTKNTAGRIIGAGSLDPGATHVLLYGTLRGFGSLGPAFRVVPIAAIPRATYLAAAATPIVFSFTDGDLGDLAFLANDPPLPGTACVSMGGSMVDLGVLGGYGASPSNVGFSEAFDVGKIVFFAAREPITGVLPYGADGVVYVSTANSLNVLVITGSDVTPVLPRGLWNFTGFASGNAFTLASRTIYGLAGNGGAVRTQGSMEPDWSFAHPVSTFFAAHGFTSANTVVVFCPDQKCVVFASGTFAVPFMLDSDKWSTPMVLPGVVTAGCAVNGVGTFLIGSSTYTLNSGNGAGLQFSLQSEFHRGQPRHPYYAASMYENIKYVRAFNAAASDPMTYTMLKDMSNTPCSPLFPWTAPSGGHTSMLPRPCGRCKSYALKVTGTGGGQQFRSVQAQIEIEPNIF